MLHFSVARLMEAVYQKTLIPVNKQILLASNGEPLRPTSRVASYSAGTVSTVMDYLWVKNLLLISLSQHDALKDWL